MSNAIPGSRQLSTCLTMFAAMLPCSGAAEVPAPAIHAIKNAEGRCVAFETVGISTSQLTVLRNKSTQPESFATVLSVFVLNENSQAELPAMLGSYELESSRLRFTPRFPLRPGMRYRAVLVPDGKAAAISSTSSPARSAVKTVSTQQVTLEITIPETRAARAAEVSVVYPTSNTLPENQLRFYLHFSAPMSRGEAYEHVRLLKADGQAVDLPFLEIGEELWDTSGKRLTLLIDPGRIKQGVKPREDLGSALEQGSQYTLVIADGWKDATGHALAREFRKTFRAGPPVRTAIDPALWKLQAPASGSREPLILLLPRPLDSALLASRLHIQQADNMFVAGEVTLAAGEQRWEFRPTASWHAGTHQLVIETVLEDLAGNRIGRPFEVDRFEDSSQSDQPEFVRIPFATVAPAGAATRSNYSLRGQE